DWTIDAKQVVPLADLIQGTYAPIMAFTKPGDGIVLPMPSYPPFQEAIQSTGRRMIETQLVLENGRYTLDFDALERQTDKTTSMFVLCNPQNPTGGVFTREELLRIGDYAIRHDLIILSDEIHGDLVYPGQRHIPIASLSPEIAARTVTLNSATKSFNIPGLRCAVIHFGTPELMKRFTDILPLKMMGQPGIIGIDATVAAWTEGREWLLSTLDHLTKVRDHVVRRLADELPGISYAVPEATYMIWLDCAGLELGMPAGKFFLEQAGIAFSAGETFDKASGHCVRFNFATSMEIADTIIDRMVEAVRKSNQAAKVAE
ncbi:MAG: aminotransferase class I/II-fold pyridoxal phosphate-dependent enzyme, partial [Pararhodobacter sp.]|nr:aminotransferase class I/II-fold pyridoxal phosphate-dependent enzyme [Pararhodobacter sp.]